MASTSSSNFYHMRISELRDLRQRVLQQPPPRLLLSTTLQPSSVDNNFPNNLGQDHEASNSEQAIDVQQENLVPTITEIEETNDNNTPTYDEQESDDDLAHGVSIDHTIPSTTYDNQRRNEPINHLSPSSDKEASYPPLSTTSTPLPLPHYNLHALSSEISLDRSIDRSMMMNMHRRLQAAISLLSESLEEQSNLRALLELTSHPHVYETILQAEIMNLIQYSHQISSNDDNHDLSHNSNDNNQINSTLTISQTLLISIKQRAMLLERDQLLTKMVELKASMKDDHQQRQQLEIDLNVCRELLQTTQDELDRVQYELNELKQELSKYRPSYDSNLSDTPPLHRNGSTGPSPVSNRSKVSKRVFITAPPSSLFDEDDDEYHTLLPNETSIYEHTNVNPSNQPNQSNSSNNNKHLYQYYQRNSVHKPSQLGLPDNSTPSLSSLQSIIHEDQEVHESDEVVHEILNVSSSTTENEEHNEYSPMILLQPSTSLNQTEIDEVNNIVKSDETRMLLPHVAMPPTPIVHHDKIDHPIDTKKPCKFPHNDNVHDNLEPTKSTDNDINNVDKPNDHRNVAIVDIDLENGKHDQIIVDLEADSMFVAYEFMEKHSLPDHFFEPLFQYIESTKNDLIQSNRIDQEGEEVDGIQEKSSLNKLEEEQEEEFVMIKEVDESISSLPPLPSDDDPNNAEDDDQMNHIDGEIDNNLDEILPPLPDDDSSISFLPLSSSNQPMIPSSMISSSSSPLFADLTDEQIISNNHQDDDNKPSLFIPLFEDYGSYDYTGRLSLALLYNLTLPNLTGQLVLNKLDYYPKKQIKKVQVDHKDLSYSLSKLSWNERSSNQDIDDDYSPIKTLPNLEFIYLPHQQRSSSIIHQQSNDPIHNEEIDNDPWPPLPPPDDDEDDYNDDNETEIIKINEEQVDDKIDYNHDITQPEQTIRSTTEKTNKWMTMYHHNEEISDSISDITELTKRNHPLISSRRLDSQPLSDVDLSSFDQPSDLAMIDQSIQSPSNWSYSHGYSYPSDKLLSNQEIGEVIAIAMDIIERAELLNQHGDNDIAMPLFHDAINLLEMAGCQEVDQIKLTLGQDML